LAEEQASLDPRFLGSPVDVEGLGVAIRAVGRSQSGNPCRGPRWPM